MNTVAPKILALLHDYRGLPLTLNDIEEEIGICECTARAVLKRLVHKGAVIRSSDPYNFHLALYRAPQGDA